MISVRLAVVISVCLMLSYCWRVAGLFIVFPMNTTQASGLAALFYCAHPDTVGYIWRVNGSSLRNYRSNSDITDYGTPINGRYVDVLSILSYPKYNGTEVQCGTLYLDGRIGETSPTVTLTVQGLLDAVVFIDQSNDALYTSSCARVLLSWEAPFSLDITDTEPDITYCVDIRNNTDGSLVQSECGLVETQYNLTLNRPSPCDSFNITVTPVNGAGNGISQTIVQHCFQSPSDVNDTPLDVVTYVSVPSKNPLAVLVTFMLSPMPVCHCQVSAIREDGYTITFNDPHEINCNSTTITLVLDGMTEQNHFYNASILFKNSAGTIGFSTHDLQTISIGRCGAMNRYKYMRLSFANGSLAKGAFVVLANTDQNGRILIERSIVFILSQEDSSAGICVSGIANGTYSVLGYDIERTGFLEMTIASPAVSMPSVVTIVNHGREGPTEIPHSSKFNIKVINGTVVVMVNCVHTEGTQNYIVILLSESESNGFMNKIHSKLLPNQCNNNSVEFTDNEEGSFMYYVLVYEDTGSGLINSIWTHAEEIIMEKNYTTVDNTTDFTESVSSYWPMYDDDHEATSSTSHLLDQTDLTIIIAASSLLGIVMMIILAAVCTICVIGVRITWREEFRPSDTAQGVKDNIEMKRCDAYEAVARKHKQVMMNENTAYDNIGPLYESIMT